MGEVCIGDFSFQKFAKSGEFGRNFVLVTYLVLVCNNLWR